MLTFLLLFPILVFSPYFTRIVFYFLTNRIQPLAMISMKVKILEIEDKDLQALINGSGLAKGKDKATTSDIGAFAKKHKVKVADVNSCLWKIRKNTGTERRITKFVEAIWRLVFYGIFVWFGYKSLFTPETREWVLDSKLNWEGWPLFDGPCEQPIQLYYQVELGCYLHQLMWTEVSRSDAAEMIIHHLATITVMFISWLCNLNRIGATILLTHDVADIFLEAGKCFNYASKAKGRKWASPVCDTLFGIFAVVFFVSRLILYPRYMVYSLLFESTEIYGGTWPGYWVMSSLLCVLQVLHIFWFSLIAKMIYKLATTGIDKDERSDDDDDDEEEEPPAETKKTK